MLGITTDSRKVKEGDIFVAIKGYTVDGHDFIDSAIKNGAKHIIAQHGNYSVPTTITDDPNKYLCNYLKDNFSDQFNNMKLIGVTGTNGKTTTCFLSYNAMINLNKKAAYIGTIGFYVNGKKIKDLPNTTPEVVSMYSLLMECKNNGCDYVFIEVSSHALALDRLYGLQFDIALFTNLTQDHLDFHKTMDNYCKTKRKLFNSLKNDKVAIINNDDKYKDNMIIKGNKNITFGFNDGDYKVINYVEKDDYSLIEFNYENILYKVKSNLSGRYNVYNLMSTIIILHNLNINLDEIINIIPTLYAPPGRMEKIVYNDNIIIIDYAHTPDALYNIIEASKDLKQGKLYVLFGCTGSRDKEKRPIMANISTQNADYSIFTTDDPWHEDPRDIINDMINGLDNNNYEIIIDRKEAIKKGISLLNKNDILLVLGRGPQEYQYVGNEKIVFNDKTVIKEIINN